MGCAGLGKPQGWGVRGWGLPLQGTALTPLQEQERSGASALETLKNHISGIFSPKFSVSPWAPLATLPSYWVPC